VPCCGGEVIVLVLTKNSTYETKTSEDKETTDGKQTELKQQKETEERPDDL